MIGSRAILQASRCSNCRKRILDAFVSTGEGRLRGPDTIHQSRKTFANTLQKRPFSYGPRRLSQQVPNDAFNGDSIAGEKLSLEEENMHEKDEASQKESEIPWYLQIETSQPEKQPSSVRLKIPDLPANPPALLQPILDHILYDLGMDDLRLLDLRQLDPPPALGANLLMVIGTARSEKHLHVSADRFRRWLRTTHQKRALTDGLIGRGELKLRRRRKARRARIMSRVGSSEVSSPDDGLRTGWVCVTIDDIEDGNSEIKALELPDDYVGFGDVTGGVKIVIQMLTREKREELDLEDLWGTMLWRHGQKEAKIVAAEAKLLKASKVGPNSASDKRPSSDLISNSSLLAPKSFQTIQVQHMHSLSSGQTELANNLRGEQNHGLANGALPLTDQSLRYALEDEDFFSFLTSALEDYQENGGSVTEEEPAAARLRRHVEYVRSLPLENALAVLGGGGPDAFSTPFLRSFQHALPLFPTVEHWKYHLSLACYGLEIEAPGYDKAYLSRVFDDMRKSVIDIPAELYLLVIRMLLTPFPTESSKGNLRLSSDLLCRAAGLLEDMIFRGHAIMTDEVRSLFELGIIRAVTVENSQELDLAAQRQVRQLLEKTFNSLTSVELEIQKLRLCADLDHWKSFWDIWGDFDIQLRLKPRELYHAALQIFAEKGHQAKTLEALRIIIPEMDHEESFVKLDGEIADALLGCLRVVEPDIDELASQDWESKDEYIQLWRRCEMVKQEENRFLREYDDD